MIRNIIKEILIITAVCIFLAIPVHAEKNVYTAGIVNDYDFSGNDIVRYAEDSLEKAFSYEENQYDELPELKFFAYTRSEAVNALNSGEVDFLAMLPLDGSLGEYFDFSREPIAAGFLSLLTRSDSQLFFEDFKAMQNSKIAMLHEPYFESMLSAYAEKNGFSYNTVYYDDVKSMCDALYDGSVDAMLSPATEAPVDMRLIAKCGGFEYYLAVRKDDKETLEIINRKLKHLKDNSPFYLSENYTKYFRLPYLNMPALTEADYNAVRFKQTLRIYAPTDNYPMVYYDVKEAKYDGIYVDIIDQIADNAGIEIDYIPNDQNDIDITLDSLMLGKADAILTASAPVSDIIKTTDPYTSVSFLSVGSPEKRIDEQYAMHIGIVRDDIWITDYMKEKYPNWTIRDFHSFNSMLWAAEHGQIDMALISVPDLQTKTSLLAHPKLAIRSEFSAEIPVCLGISIVTCPPDVVTMLNNLIRNAYVPSSDFESRVYTLSNVYIPNFRDMLYANKLVVFVVLLIFAAVLGLLRLREMHYKRLARMDHLTHIYNQRYFEIAAEKIMSKKPDVPYILAVIDAVNFKLVNERFGTDIGDQTLVSIASKIKDIWHGHGLYARQDADKFLVLAEDSAYKRALMADFEKMDIHIHNSSNYRVYIKIGVCPIAKCDPSVPLSRYIDNAKIAKRNAEGVQHNFLRYFTEEMEKRLETENEIEVDMAAALARGEFIAWYQPKYDLSNDKIIGAEALVRWKHKDKGLIPPGIFVPIFERNGFINEVDFCVYETVFKMLRKRLRSNKEVVTVSLNVSRCHLTDKDFINKLEALAAKYEIPKKHIEMEITESIFSEGDNSAGKLVHELKKRDFAVSMDDFGSGYSSLNLLRQMPIDTLKIDKAFIDDIEESSRSLTIIEEIISMAKRINVKTICEGIETKGQRDILKKAGCNMAQGYYYSKPLEESEFESLLDLTISPLYDKM